MGSLLPLVPGFPLLGAVLLTILNRKASRKIAGTIASLMVLASAGISFAVLAELLGSGHGEHAATISHTLYNWFTVGDLTVDIGFGADPLAATMMCIVTGVGFLIHVYAIGYMDDPKDAQSTWRFFAYLNLFVFAMLLLVMGDNFLLMFVGWEGVGLCSYLLIGFWFENSEFAAAGKKAFVTNRVGDFCFVLGLFWLFWSLGEHATLKFSELEHVIITHPELLGGVGGFVVTGITLLFFGGATGKSAQIPLFIWLPDAMAGPTPVSALIHAATMVTSGIYMICRLSFLFAMSPVTMGVVATIGALTALLAATIAVSQNDIKKVLAYSTVSQLGYMFLGVGIGGFAAGFFHVMTHAFFKALLFLGAGAVIHACHHEQDMRNMGGLKKKMPITFLVFVAAWLAIIGMPGFSGFFSKDEILWLTFATPASQIALFGDSFPLPKILWFMGLVTAGLTAFYMSRLMFMTFWGEYRGGQGHGDDGHGGHEPHEVSPIMWVPLAVLAVLSVVGGLINLPHWIHNDQLSGKLHHFLNPVFAHADGALGIRFDAADTSLEFPLMGVALVVVALGVGLAWKMYGPSGSAEPIVSKVPAKVLRGSQNKWYVDEIYGATIIKPLVHGSHHILWSVIDAQIIDGIVNGIAAAFRRLANAYSRYVQVGQLQGYALAVCAGTAVIVLILVLGA